MSIPVKRLLSGAAFVYTLSLLLFSTMGMSQTTVNREQAALPVIPAILDGVGISTVVVGGAMLAFIIWLGRSHLQLGEANRTLEMKISQNTVDNLRVEILALKTQIQTTQHTIEKLQHEIYNLKRGVDV